MKNISLIIVCTVSMLAVLQSDKAWGQKQAESLYNSDKFYTDGLYQKVKIKDKEQLAKTVSQLLNENKPLKEGMKISLNKPSVKANLLLDNETIFEKCKKSVLMIGKLRRGKVHTTNSAEIMATGFILDKDGTCVTNYHVLWDIIESASSDVQQSTDSSFYFVKTFDGAIFLLDKLLTYSKSNDLAVFKIKTKDNIFPQALPLGDPAKVGANVSVIAHPDNNFYYYTNGIVSKNSQELASGPLAGIQLRMEITADYAIGSSGGPILDKYGNVVGVVSSTSSIYTSNLPRSLQMVLKRAIPVAALNKLLN